MGQFKTINFEVIGNHKPPGVRIRSTYLKCIFRGLNFEFLTFGKKWETSYMLCQQLPGLDQAVIRHSFHEKN